MDHDAVFARLRANRMGHPATIVPEPGVFAVFTERRDCLPCIEVPETGILYIGQAADLSERNLFELPGNLQVSSPWRTLGAILRDRLGLVARPGSVKKRACDHYRFDDAGERELESWIREHLLISTYPIAARDDCRELKKQLVRTYGPPLNLEYPHGQTSKIIALRNRCKQEAGKRV